MKKDSFFLGSRLLSERKKLTVQEKDDIIRAVLADLRRNEEKGAVVRFLQSVPLPVRVASLAAALLLLAVPLVMVLSRPKAIDELVAGGGDGSLLSHFSVSCLTGKSAAACSRGDKLVFRVSPPEGRPYFAAFGHRLSDHAVIWYFPESDTSKTPLIGDISQNGLLSQGIRLGNEHAEGRYEAFGLFFEKPVRREDIQALLGEHFERRNESFTVSKVALNINNNNNGD